MADFLFDGPNKIITEPAGAGALTQFDVDRDIYSAWKRWADDNAQFLPAFIVEGGTPIGATGLFTGTTFILTNGWKIKPADFDHQLLLNGNIFSDDGIVGVPADTASATVVINASTQAQGVSTSGGTFTNADRVALETARDHACAANEQTKTPPP